MVGDEKVGLKRNREVVTVTCKHVTDFNENVLVFVDTTDNIQHRDTRSN